MARRTRKVRTFFKRLSFAWTNALRSTKQFKKTGIVFLPNGSVLCDPRRSLVSFGYEVRPTSYANRYSSDEDDGF